MRRCPHAHSHSGHRCGEPEPGHGARSRTGRGAAQTAVGRGAITIDAARAGRARSRRRSTASSSRRSATPATAGCTRSSCRTAASRTRICRPPASSRATSSSRRARRTSTPGKPNNWRLRWDVDRIRIRRGRSTRPAAAHGAIELVVDRPLNDATPHSLQVDVTAVPAGRPRPGARERRLLGHGRHGGRDVPPELLRAHGCGQRSVDASTAVAPTARRSARRDRRASQPGGWRQVRGDARRERDRAEGAARAVVPPTGPRLARHGLALPGEDVQEPAERPASGPRADGRGSEARLHPRARRLLRRRHHGREPAAVEAIDRSDRDARAAPTVRGATGAPTASGTTSSCSSPKTSAPMRCGS